MVAQKEIMIDEKNIKIVTFETEDNIIYGKSFSAYNVDNVTTYNDAYVEVEDELNTYPKTIWIGNIDTKGIISEHDKNPFTNEYMLDCRYNDGRPYRFMRRMDVYVDNSVVCARSKDIQVICLETTDIYDTTNHEIYLLDTYDGVIHGRKMTDFGDMELLNDYSWCCYISKHVLMYKDYCDIAEWDDHFKDKGLGGMCYHYCLYNTDTHKKIGFIAPNASINYFSNHSGVHKKDIYNEISPIVLDLLNVDEYGSKRMDGVKLWLDSMTLTDNKGKDLSYILDKE